MSEQMESTGFVVGLDLGQAADFTALCVVERLLPPRESRPAWEPPPPVYSGTYNADGTARLGVQALYLPPADRREATYHVRHLERLPLGTKYPAIVQRVQGLLGTPPLDVRRTPLVIDRTGVGRAVTDMFEGGAVQPYAITITGGDQVSQEGREFRVPKRDLVGVLVALFGGDRLRIAAGLAEGATLVNELLNFKVKINIATGNDSYESWRESTHDDLVLAVAMACWYGEAAPKREIRFLRD